MIPLLDGKIEMQKSLINNLLYQFSYIATLRHKSNNVLDAKGEKIRFLSNGN